MPPRDLSEDIAYYQVLLALLIDHDLLDLDAIPYLTRRLESPYGLSRAQHTAMIAAMEARLAPIGFTPRTL